MSILPHPKNYDRNSIAGTIKIELTLGSELLFALIIAQLNYIWFLINKYFSLWNGFSKLKSFKSEWKRKYFPFTSINAPKTFLRKWRNLSKMALIEKGSRSFAEIERLTISRIFYQSENYWNHAKLVLRLIKLIKNVKTGNIVGQKLSVFLNQT